MDGLICDAFQDAGDDCDSLRARLEQVESEVTALTKRLDPLAQQPERIKNEIPAEAPDVISSDAEMVQNSVAKTRDMSCMRMDSLRIRDDGMRWRGQDGSRRERWADLSDCATDMDPTPTVHQDLDQSAAEKELLEKTLRDTL